MPGETESDPRQPLVSPATVRSEFNGFAFAGSHGAFGDHLGAGILYYALAQMVRAQVAVCIGSGGGFVPALVRRAQLDAGIAPAATYLVDANLPDLAFGSPVQLGGWMTAENPFLARESDIVVLPMLSSDAAKLFAAQRITIDYLHIDGDHSRDGMLADFRDYAPLVSSEGVITFHDLAMPSIGAALATIAAEYPEWEHVGFAEIGAGTGVLRRRQRGPVQRRTQNKEGFVDAGRCVTLQTAPVRDAIVESQERARYERWHYLASPAYQLRYRLAATEIDTSGATIVEIGGFPNSVVGVIAQALRVHAIEPYAPDAYRAKTEADARAKGIDWLYHPVALSALSLRPADLGAYNLLALGFDLTAGEDSVEGLASALHNFARLLAAAKRAVVEIPGYRPSEAAWEAVAAALEPKIVFDVTMDLRRDPVASVYFVRDERALRRMIVIDGTACADVDAASVQAALHATAVVLIGAKQAQAAPVDPDYAIGTVITFNTVGNSDLFVRSGWRGAEARFRWSTGEEARLSLRLAEDDLGQASMFIARVTIEPFVVPVIHPSQRIQIAVNGQALAEHTVTERTTLTVPVSRASLLSQPVAQFSFMQPDYRRPFDILPGNKDKAQLAFRFFDFVLLPVTPGNER